jgi:hypothetical protein
MITLADVKHWIPSGKKNRGDCILAGTNSGWVSSLCGWMGPANHYEGPPPKMICGKCKAAMNTAVVHTENAPHERAAAADATLQADVGTEVDR